MNKIKDNNLYFIFIYILGSLVQERKETPQDGVHPFQGTHNLVTGGLRSGRNYEKMLRIVRILLQRILTSEDKIKIKQRLAYLKMPRFGKRINIQNAEDNGENSRHQKA